MKMPDFDSALKFVLAREGGYVNDPADPGGATNFGITQKTYDRWQDAHNQPKGDVKDIPSLTVRAIYADNYWAPSGCDSMDQSSALCVFDTAVNIGVARTKVMWAAALNDVNRFLWLRLRYYDEIAVANPALAKFVRGWLHRVLALHDMIGAK